MDARVAETTPTDVEGKSQQRQQPQRETSCRADRHRAHVPI